MAGINQRFRGRKLQGIRAAYFAAHPLCVMCQAKTPPRITIATDLDHITALTNGGKDDADNRQGLCAPCHEVKTAQDMGYEHKPRMTVGIDGWPQPSNDARPRWRRAELDDG